MTNLPQTSLYVNNIKREFDILNSEFAGLTSLTTDYSSYMDGGLVVQVPTIGNIDVADYTDGATVTPSNASFTNNTITLSGNQATVQVSRLLKGTSQVAALEQSIANQLSRGYQRYLEGKIVTTAGSATTVGTNLTNSATDQNIVDRVKTVLDALRANSVMGKIYGVVNPRVLRAVENIIGARATNLGDALTTNGAAKMGTAKAIEFEGITMVDSTLAGTNNSFFTADAIGWAARAYDFEVNKEPLSHSLLVQHLGQFGSSLLKAANARKFVMATS